MAEAAAETSQGGDDALPPDERRPAVDIADDFPRVVDTERRARFARTEGGREVGDAAIVPEHGAVAGRRGGQRGTADNLAVFVDRLRHAEIGRASRRERVYTSERAGS